MNKETLIEILADWNLWKRDIDSGIPRPVYLKKILEFMESNKIISVVGVTCPFRNKLFRLVS